MNVFNKVTIQSLKKNKTRTTVTIIGIILSAAMICAVTSFTSSIQNYMLQNAVYKEGDWHGSETNVGSEIYKELLDTGKLEKATLLQQLGYALAEDCKNEYKPYIYLLGADENTKEMLPIHITSGAYPKSSEEILLPEHILTNGGTAYKIGDVITLELGERSLDGDILGQGNPYSHFDESGEEIKNSESLMVRESRTYRVTGFYERFPIQIEAYEAPGYTAITLADSEAYASYKFSIYFKMKKPKEVYGFMEEHGLNGKRNADLLTYSGISRRDGFNSMLYGMAAVIIGLIMFGSVSLIYNAFAISVSERTKQFGLLSSIGATKKQLKRMVLFEALAVSAIGIPIGIISGIAGIGITLMLIGNKFISLGFPIEMEIYVSVPAVITAAAVALITVLISAWIPSKRATRVTAVEAIRQNHDIVSKRGKVKTSKLIYRLFGLPGVLADKHYKRSKKKYRATIVSLFMSIVLFVSASSFGSYLMESVEGGFGSAGYDLEFTAIFDNEDSSLTPDGLLEKTANNKNIELSAYVQDYYYSEVDIDKSLLNKKSLSLLYSEDESSEYAQISCVAYFVNDGEFKKILKENKLSEEEFFNIEKPLAIALDGSVYFDGEKGKYVSLNLLNSDTGVFNCKQRRDEIDGYRLYDVSYDNGEEIYKYRNTEDEKDIIELNKDEASVKYTIVSGKTIYEPPFYIKNNYTRGIKLIYPISMRDYVIPEEVALETRHYTFYYTSSDHKASYTALVNTLKESGLGERSVYDYAEDVESNRNLVIIIQVFSYGFIVLISLIAAANVFNTISTNISLRRREFAMLKSVGMSSKGFNRMMNFECLLYGSRALILGLPVSAGVTWLIYRSVLEGFETSFHLPWAAMGIATLSVFLVVFATMVYSMSKIKKDNPIDALKNENI